MFRLVAHARLLAEILLALRRVNRSARSRSAIRCVARLGGRGRCGRRTPLGNGDTSCK